MLQDANYNVVALVSGGCPRGVPRDECALPPAGAVLQQYTYTPYGQIVATDMDLASGGLLAPPVNRVGFQGLFFERYDGDYTQPCIAPGVRGLYYARNRFYDPILGRFIQRDPNETALPIITALAMNGEAVDILMGGFNAGGLYSDGMSLYQFARSNPVNGRDASGLNTFTYSEELVVVGEGTLLDGIGSWCGRLALKFAGKVVGRALAYGAMITMLMYADGGPMMLDPAAASAFSDDITRFWDAAKDAGKDAKDAMQQSLGDLGNLFKDWFSKFNRVYNNIREWEGWDPAFKKAGEQVERVKDPQVLRMLRNTLEGTWNKVYMYGQDGREIHFFRHASGKIVGPKWAG